MAIALIITAVVLLVGVGFLWGNSVQTKQQDKRDRAWAGLPDRDTRKYFPGVTMAEWNLDREAWHRAHPDADKIVAAQSVAAQALATLNGTPYVRREAR